MAEMNTETVGVNAEVKMVLKQINLISDLLKNDDDFSSSVRVRPVETLQERKLDVCLPISKTGEMLSALLERTAPVLYESTLDSVRVLLERFAKGKSVALPNNFWGVWTNGAATVEVVANVVAWTEVAVATFVAVALAIAGSDSNLDDYASDITTSTSNLYSTDDGTACCLLKQCFGPEFRDSVAALAPSPGLSTERLIATVRNRALKGDVISHLTDKGARQETWVRAFSFNNNSYTVKYITNSKMIKFETISLMSENDL